MKLAICLLAVALSTVQSMPTLGLALKALGGAGTVVGGAAKFGAGLGAGLGGNVASAAGGMANVGAGLGAKVGAGVVAGVGAGASAGAGIAGKLGAGAGGLSGLGAGLDVKKQLGAAVGPAGDVQKTALGSGQELGSILHDQDGQGDEELNVAKQLGSSADDSSDDVNNQVGKVRSNVNNYEHSINNDELSSSLEKTASDNAYSNKKTEELANKHISANGDTEESLLKRAENTQRTSSQQSSKDNRQKLSSNEHTIINDDDC